MNNPQDYPLKDNILIVDDNPVNLNLLSEILSKQGYKVRAALSSTLALKSLQLTHPDLILLDILMPEMDGYEVCQQLKSSPITKDIPVIFISALNESLDKVKAFTLGGVDYITKPFQAEEVLVRIENQLRLQRLSKQLLEQNSQLHQELLERQRTEQELELQAVITKNMPGGICLVRAADWFIVYANPKFERMFGYEMGELNGKPVTILNYEDDQNRAEEMIQPVMHQIESDGEATYEIHNVKKDGTSFWCRATSSKFNHPAYGTVYVVVQYDITEQKQAEALIKASLKEKEVLLKEIHHRVKNNLQIVSSLLQMQFRRTQEKEAALVLQDSQNRIASIALVHEKLYRSDNLANIDFAQYIPALTTHLFDSYKVSSEAVVLYIKVDNIFLEIETAIPCSLIINELVSNSLKYAFPANRQGEIAIEFHANSDHTMTLIVRDNGIGILEEFDIATTTSLGLTLVQGLVEQLEGMLELNRSQGTEFKITFPGGGRR
jgi:PAS domain S-box-containing protein